MAARAGGLQRADFAALERDASIALQIYRRLGTCRMANCGIGLGTLAFWRNDSHAGAVADVVGPGDGWVGQRPACEARALGSLGAIARASRDYQAARRYIGRAAETFQRLGDRYGWSASLNSMAELHRSLGDLEAAEPIYRQAVEVRTAIGAPDGGAGHPSAHKLAQATSTPPRPSSARPMSC
jgi:tetratricopeptide (TPR) repeat protein